MIYGKSCFLIQSPSWTTASRPGQAGVSVLLQQTTQSFLDSYLWFPAELLAYTTQIRDIINRHGMRQGVIVHNGRFQLNQSADSTYYLQQGCRVFPSAT